jgi:hypothetical protein
VKKYNRIFVFSLTCILIGFGSCKKINEATTLGGDLIPPIDNINTFEAILSAETYNRTFLNDSSVISFVDDVAIGHISADPVFGKTTADAYFSIGRPNSGYPFVGERDSITIDSVILSLAYMGFYGDTNSTLSYSIREIAQNSDFKEDTFFSFTRTPFETAGQLGSKNFTIKSLRDTLTVAFPRDTVRINNVLRIPLDNSLGVRLKNYDTTGQNNAYTTDSAFKSKFKGLALLSSEVSGNALAYFNVQDRNTRVTVYYKSKINGVDSALRTDFFHLPFSGFGGFRNGKANLVRREAGGEWAQAIANAATPAEKLYIQSTPGSMAKIRIPGLDTFKNRVIHRAELIVPKLSSAMDNVFTPPSFLFLDRINQANNVPSTLHNDIFFNENSYTVARFGGRLLTDNTYRFIITRHVQGIVTRNETNDTLRLHAPLRVLLYDNNFRSNQMVSVIDEVAKGRVVVAGGNHPTAPLRLRIIYSNL